MIVESVSTICPSVCTSVVQLERSRHCCAIPTYRQRQIGHLSSDPQSLGRIRTRPLGALLEGALSSQGRLENPLELRWTPQHPHCLDFVWQRPSFQPTTGYSMSNIGSVSSRLRTCLLGLSNTNTIAGAFSPPSLNVCIVAALKCTGAV